MSNNFRTSMNDDGNLHLNSHNGSLHGSHNSGDAYCRYPLHLPPDNLPMIKMTLCIPIPESFFASVEKFVFMGTPRARACYNLICFILMMIYRRYVLKAKPKRKKDGTLTEPGLEDDVSPDAAGTPADRANAAVDEELQEQEEEEQEMDETQSSELEETNPAAGISDVLPATPASAASAPPDAIPDALDPNYNINFINHGENFRKVRLFMENVIQGPGVSSGYLLWVIFYESETVGSMFSSLMGYNSVFRTKPSNMEKFRTTATPVEKAAMCVHSVNEYLRYVRMLMPDLPEQVLTLRDITDFNSAFHLQHIFSVGNAMRVFPEFATDGSRLCWNWRRPPTAFSRSPYSCYYPWFICEIPPEQVEAPETIRGLRTYLIEEVCKILTNVETLPPLPAGASYTDSQIAVRYGELNTLREHAIQSLLARLPNKLLAVSRESCDPLFIKHNYFYAIYQSMKEKRKTMKEEDIFHIFREMYDDVSNNLVAEGANLNASTAQKDIFEKHSHIKLPQKFDPLIYPQTSDLPPLGNVLHQFCENLQKYLRVHKGDRFSLLLHYFLTSMPIDSEEEDLPNVAAMGPQQKGKSTAAVLVQFLIARERIFALNNATNNSFHVLGNWNGKLIICDEADIWRMLGISTNGNKSASDMSPLVNDIKMIFVNGGWLLNTHYDTSNKEERFNKSSLFQSNATFLFIANASARLVATAPVASRLFHMRFTDEGKTQYDADELNNDDSKITPKMRDEFTGYAKQFIDFCEFVDRVLFIYNHYELMGAFESIPKNLILAQLNSLNAYFRRSKIGFRLYDDRLKGRVVTLIRRFSKWLCISAFFGTEIGRNYIEESKKLTLDFDVLIELYKFIKANTPSLEAMAFVISTFSNENTHDCISMIHQLIKKYYNANDKLFTANEDETCRYVRSPFGKKTEFLERLVDVSDFPITVEDLDNYFAELIRATVKSPDGKNIHPLRFHSNAEKKLAIEIHLDFIAMDQGPRIRLEYLRILTESLSLEYTLPRKVITSFALNWKVGNKDVRLGGAFQHLLLGKGKNALTFSKRSTSMNRDDPAFVQERFSFDFGYDKDPTRHYTLALRRSFNQALNIANTAIPAQLLCYPDYFADQICQGVIVTKEKAKYAKVCKDVVTAYTGTMDKTVDTRDHEGDICQHLRLERGQVPRSILNEFDAMLVDYQIWCLHLYHHWMVTASKARWLLAIQAKAFDVNAPRRETLVNYHAAQLDTNNALSAFCAIGETRKRMVAFNPRMELAIGEFCVDVCDAVKTLKMQYAFHVLNGYRNWDSLRPAQHIPLKKDIDRDGRFADYLSHVQTQIKDCMDAGHIQFLSNNAQKFSPIYYHMTIDQMLSYDPLHDADKSVSGEIPKQKDVFLSAERIGAAKISPPMQTAVKGYHDVMLRWFKIVYVYGIVHEWKMDLILYLVLRDDFAVNAIYYRIQYGTEYLDSLNPAQCFADLRTSYDMACRELRACAEFKTLFEKKAKKIPPAAEWEDYLNTVDLGTKLFSNYNVLYKVLCENIAIDKYVNDDESVTEMGNRIFTTSNIVDSTGKIIFENKYKETVLLHNYDFTKLITWPSRPRTTVLNVNCYEEPVGRASVESVLPVAANLKRPRTNHQLAQDDIRKQKLARKISN